MNGNQPRVAGVTLFAAATLLFGSATGRAQSATSNSGSPGNGSGASGANAGTTGSGGADATTGSVYGLPNSATNRATPSAQTVPGARSMTNSGEPSNRVGVQPVKGVDSGATTEDSHGINTANGTTETTNQNSPASERTRVDRNDPIAGAGSDVDARATDAAVNPNRATGTSRVDTSTWPGTYGGTVGGSAPGTSGSGVGRAVAPNTGSSGTMGTSGNANGSNLGSASAGKPDAKAQRDVVDVATSEGQFGTFLRALRATGLSETLKGPGPYTILAPTDAAFTRIPKIKLDKLFADRQALTELVKHHVISGKVTASALGNIPNQQPLVGSSLRVTRGPRGGVEIEESNVVRPDIEAANGIIHAIDDVIVPATVKMRLLK